MRARRRPYLDRLGLAHLFDPVLRKLPAGPVNLNDDRLTVAREGRLRIVYVPFDLINPAARVMLVGLTPGAYQARLGLDAARNAHAAGATALQAHRDAKLAAAFAGPLRRHLVEMLDAIGIAEPLGARSAAELFAAPSGLVHSTSALRYAVFRDGRNYLGSPSPIRSPLLAKSLITLLGPEIAAVPEALVIPLGVRATECVDWLVGQGLVDGTRVLRGVPHPSGANGHRVASFAIERRRLRREVRSWFRG